MQLKSILFIVVMTGLNQLIVNQSQDFCESFHNNGFEIDYGYEHRNYTPYGHEFFLFIGHDYWRLQWNDLWTRLEFNSTLSQNIQWFDSEYKIAVQQWFCAGEQLSCDFMTGLLNKRKNLIVWEPIKFDPIKESLLRSVGDKNFAFNKSKIEFDFDFDPSVGNRNIFVQQKKSNQKYYRTFRSFEFDGETGEAINITDRLIDKLKSSMKMEEISYESDETIVNNLIDFRTESLRMISMFADDTDLSFYLFKEDMAITYCIFDGFLNCIEDRLLLINCSVVLKNTIVSESTQSSLFLATDQMVSQEIHQQIDASNRFVAKNSDLIHNSTDDKSIRNSSESKSSPLFWFIISLIFLSWFKSSLVCYVLVFGENPIHPKAQTESELNRLNSYNSSFYF